MEDNLVSKLSSIQESTNTSFKTDYDSGVNVDAEIMLIYISSLLTKRIDELSEDEKDFLDNAEIVLGAENYKEVKELIWSFIVAKVQNVQVVDQKNLEDKFDRIKSLLQNYNGLKIAAPNSLSMLHKDEDNGIFDWIKSSASKSWDSFKEIANDLWKGVEVRGSKWNDSPYDFINWLTLGMPDTIKSLGEMNYQNGLKALDTGNVYDIGNWLTMNQFDMIKGTFNPSEPFSKEHWLDSLGTASVLFGLKNIEDRKPSLNVKEKSYTFKSMKISGVVKNNEVICNYAHNAAIYDKLKTYYYQAQKYGKGGIRQLKDGRFRFYEELQLAKKQGEMAGLRHVREWNPKTGLKRDWYETIDHSGKVRQVRPKVEVTGGVKVHYVFDSDGNYIRCWSPEK